MMKIIIHRRFDVRPREYTRVDYCIYNIRNKNNTQYNTIKTSSGRREKEELE